MYSSSAVPIPKCTTGISIKKIGNVRYVYFNAGFKYDKEKKKTSPQSKSIGKVKEDDCDRMYPNENYEIYFPDESIKYGISKNDADDDDAEDNYNDDEDDDDADDDDEGSSKRSKIYVHQEWVTKVGAYIVIDEILERLHLKEILKNIIGNFYALFLDFASFMIITADNTGWHYPDYGAEHALFTKDMRVASKSTITRFFQNVNEGKSYEFLDVWNKMQDHSHKIYVCYDSTNKNCQAGDVDMADYGNAKDDPSKMILNYAVAYDLTNKKPLIYEYYPGCVNDVTQIQNTIETLKRYGYNMVAFIVDRGYFSIGNIKFMDANGFDFLIMVKGMRKLVHDLVSSVRGTFETNPDLCIVKYGVYGTTCKSRLSSSDDKDRYFHIFYNPYKAAHEQRQLTEKIETCERTFKKKIGKSIKVDKDIEKYFSFEFNADGKLISYKRNSEVIQDYIEHSGYFAIISSQEMTASEALTLYKSRDVNEKLFRMDKSYMGNNSTRTHSSESTCTKMFVSFIALIIRNEMHVLLRERADALGKWPDYMTAAGALSNLEKVKIVRTSKYEYKLTHELTKKQKQIFSAFGITPAAAKRRALDIGKQLKSVAEKDPNSEIYLNKHK